MMATHLHFAAGVLPAGYRAQLAPSRRLTSARRRPRDAKRRGSLDTDKYLLATSAHGSAQPQKNNEDTHEKCVSPRADRAAKLHLRHILLDSLEQIWHPHCRMPGVPFRPSRQKEWERIYNCQAEWIGFKAMCCDHDTVAVPIGCNHRLCPMCNGHRAEKYRERVARMFDAMKHPVMITLTVPNVRRITKRTYRVLRGALKQFLKAQGGWISGGLYSIETTYNAAEGTWHPHVHVLCDSVQPLPRQRAAFIRFKRNLEFDWFHYTGGRAWRREQWHRAVAERAAPRRVVDVRPIRGRRKAAAEVLKYITKVSAFSHLPAELDQFLSAVKHTRMIQTFGSWYRFKFSEDVNDPKDWTQLRCTCGANCWEKLGLFHKHEVTMDDTGRWRVRAETIAHRRKPPDRTFDKFRRETRVAWSKR